MNKKYFITLYILIIAAIIAAVAYYELSNDVDSSPAAETPAIASFDECAAAGYPIAESYPEQCSTPDGGTFVREIGNEQQKQDLIRLASPRPNDKISSPLTITGEARGNWYFEASFPIRVEAADGTVLASGYAQALGDWMTEDFVPFSATIEFKGTPGTAGKLVLEKDNPSGLPEHDDALVVPVSFDVPRETMTVLAYFPNEAKNPTTDCSITYPVFRTVAKSQAPARAALEQLLSGPTEEEEGLGYSNPIPNGVGIKALAIDAQGVARVDFTNTLKTGGACAVTAIRAQIEQTLRQFPSVKDVHITIEGEKNALQP